MHVNDFESFVLRAALFFLGVAVLDWVLFGRPKPKKPTFKQVVRAAWNDPEIK